ncbi:MAG TPA: lipid-binding SYLF domain-containing protein [Steroidobacteraceae bacterium]|nr:lipid-binding SYLF domain-containing protein [Steroidobacteraceae bacterium]
MQKLIMQRLITQRLGRFRKMALWSCASIVGLAMLAGVAYADRYSDTADLFRHAGQSGKFFASSYGYAIFPTIGKGGFGIGAAHGDGRVYQQGRYVGDTSMTQVSFGFQLGGQAYSEIIFFQNRDALKRFESGNFALSADASAVAITASASASAGTEGSQAAASGGEDAARTAGYYQDGMAIFTIAKGGLMYQAAVAGQKFSFRGL